MSTILKTFIFVFFGVLIGFLIYDQFIVPNDQKESPQDTSFVKNVNAQQISYNDGSTEQINLGRHNAITRTIEKVSPAVVSVNVTKLQVYTQRSPLYVDPFFRELFPELFSDRRYQQYVSSVGSGFLISSDGYLLTNEHVVEDATEVVVAMEDGNEYKAEIIGVDAVSDVALLKIEGKNLPFIQMGNSDELIIGEWAIALGNPFGLFVKSKPTVTVGVISAIDRDFSRQQGKVFEDMIQTDASINPGNSGGPLCNANGEVIGMNTFIYSENRGSVGIGFAIPIKRVSRVVDDLRSEGRVDRDIWIGLYVSNLSRFLVRQLNYSSTTGVYVVRIDRGSPAEKSGIRLGDIITRINDRVIANDKEAEDVILSSDLRVGDTLKIRVWRENREIDINIILEKRGR